MGPSIRGGISSKNPATQHDTATPRRLTGNQQTPYGIRLVQADQVPTMGSSFTPKICIIDSGYDLGHEDLPVEPQVTGDSDIGGAGEWFNTKDNHGIHVAGTPISLPLRLI
jgi:serine protease